MIQRKKPIIDKRDNSSDRRSNNSSEGENGVVTEASDRRKLERRENETLVDFERRRNACRREKQRREGARRKD